MQRDDFLEAAQRSIMGGSNGCPSAMPSCEAPGCSPVPYSTSAKAEIERLRGCQSDTAPEGLVVKMGSVLDARFAKSSLLAADERGFSSLLGEVDARLKQDAVPISSRPLRAISIVCQRGGFSLALGEPLANRISAWFEGQYGDRLHADLSLGSGPVLIRGDLYEMHSPWLLGGAQIVCSADDMHRASNPDAFTALPVLNVLEFIVGLTQQRASELTTTELRALQQEFCERQELFSELRKLQNDEAFGPGQGDLRGAVDLLLQGKPQRGGARWACLQAVEKFLKAWISKQGASFPKTHTLAELNDRASQLGLARVSDADLAVVQCPAGVRYGEIPVSSEEVAAAFNAALRCCAFVAGEIGRSEQDRRPNVRVPEPNALTRQQFLSLKEGDLLRSGGIQMVIMAVAQGSPRWYRTLVVGATKETMIIEDDFLSFALVKRGPIWLCSSRGF